MENNKNYLQKIHWVFLISIASACIEVFLKDWLASISSARTAYIFLYVISFTCLYAALGIATSKWKETAIAWSIEVLLYAVRLTLVSTQFTGNIYKLIVFFILSGVPIAVFFALQSGWTKKLATAYFAAIALPVISTLSFYAPQLVDRVTDSFMYYSGTWRNFFVLISKTAGMVFTVICLCELNNFMQGKKDAWKTRLLNPGNEYGRLNSLIAFWVTKVMFFVIIAGGGYFLYSIFGLFAESNRFSGINRNYYRIAGFINIVCLVAIALILVWYMRKFLLEYFISYNISSKFLYWLSLIPVIGSMVFGILQLHDTKHGQYREKVNAIGNFAASSSTPITIIFIFIFLLRLILRIESGGAVFIVSIIASSLLFFCFIVSKTGYYVTLALNGLILAAATVVLLIGQWDAAYIALAFSLILFNLMQTALTFPVYHFGEFEYILAQNTDPKQPENPAPPEA